MKNVLTFLILGLFTLSFYSCYYDKADVLYPVGAAAPCPDSVGTISYLKQVVPILQNQCYGCHSGAGASGGIVMGTYAADKAIASNGKLYGSINFQTGFSPMPKGAAKMNSCNLAVIRKWIAAGQLNN